MSLEVGGTDAGGGDVGNSAVDSNKDVVVKEGGNDVQVKKAQAAAFDESRGDDTSTRKKRADPQQNLRRPRLSQNAC